mmetsp:Transcript_43779/g.138348  ORF Transcript_43779/g.138348 Transcript_43779/m.138348 type:complete len:87 (-) Transcript_43779:107-367(-)
MLRVLATPGTRMAGLMRSLELREQQEETSLTPGAKPETNPKRSPLDPLGAGHGNRVAGEDGGAMIGLREEEAEVWKLRREEGGGGG